MAFAQGGTLAAVRSRGQVTAKKKHSKVGYRVGYRAAINATQCDAAIYIFRGCLTPRVLRVSKYQFFKSID
jgi:hypothetical protein